MTNVPFLDLGRMHASIRADLDTAIDRVITASSLVGGKEVEAFEHEFGAAHDLPRGAGCGSGTDALALALRALGVGPGDEVVVPAMTFVATAEAAVHVGATPVVADVDPVTLLLTPETVGAVTTERTRAVITVHLYGHMVDPAALQQWRDQGLVVVEDAAQAHLAHHRGTGVGQVGHAACFSFYPGKNLGALGDGGMVLSADEEVTAEVRRLRNHGRTGKYVHDDVGWCSRLDGIQAAVLGAKLPHLARWTEARRALAAVFRGELGAHLVPWDDGAVHHLLVSRVGDREKVATALAERGIGTGIHYPVALSQQPWLVDGGAVRAPAAERAADEVLSLPMDPLMTVDEAVEVARSFLDVVGG